MESLVNFGPGQTGEYQDHPYNRPIDGVHEKLEVDDAVKHGTAPSSAGRIGAGGLPDHDAA